MGLMVLFLLFFLFLASEALLFVSFFWASFHSLSSPTLGIWSGEGFYLPDPCELTFANTLLLSNAAVSLGGAFVSLEFSFHYSLSYKLGLLLIYKSKNFGSWVYLLMNQFIVVFFFLTGLHFFHLVLGLLLLSLLFWSCSFPVKKSLFFTLRVSEVYLFYNLQNFYWHFLEI